MMFFDPGLDLRGRKVRLRGDGGGDGPIAAIPQEAARCRRPKHIAYLWSAAEHAREVSKAFQNIGEGAADACDVVEVLDEPDTSAPSPAYQFRARRFQDIDLARISREIGTAPYALVAWDDQSMVIAGEQALRRAEAVDYIPVHGSGWRRLCISPSGRASAHGGPYSVTGWYGPDAQAHAAEWWAEVRRRERPDVVVTVTPATPAT